MRAGPRVCLPLAILVAATLGSAAASASAAAPRKLEVPVFKIQREGGEEPSAIQELRARLPAVIRAAPANERPLNLASGAPITRSGPPSPLKSPPITPP